MKVILKSNSIYWHKNTYIIDKVTYATILASSVCYVCGLPPIKIDFNVIRWLQKHDSEFSANRNQYQHE